MAFLCGRRSGFTMIELLMVILLIAMLGAAALPQFLDFRNEAKVAVLQQNLYNIRVAYKNQLQQALLKCGAALPPWTNGFSTLNTVFKLLYENGRYNDITYHQSNSERLCTTEQVPDPSDRSFLNLSDAHTAHSYASGGIEMPVLSMKLPVNPFFDPGTSSSRPARVVSLNTIATAGGGTRCGYVSSIVSEPFMQWFYIEDTGEWFAGTNTAGINECDF